MSEKPSRQQCFVRACVYPVLKLCCWGFPACPNCQSIDGFGTGFRGDNGKTHGTPDYAPPAIQGYHCQRCGYTWERPYHEKPEWYYAIRLFPNRFIRHKTYRKILARIDYSYPLKKIR
jgi:hypothetical protein